MTLGDKIRAMKISDPFDPYGYGFNAALDRAAALADEHEATIAAGLQYPVAVHANMLRGTIAKPSWEQIMHLYPVEAKATIAAAYEAAALMTGPNPDNEIATAIRARVPADARAALDRIKREARKEGVLAGIREATAHCREFNDGGCNAAAILAAAGEAGNG